MLAAVLNLVSFHCLTDAVAIIKVWQYGQHFPSTCLTTLLHCKLKPTVVRITACVTNTLPQLVTLYFAARQVGQARSNTRNSGSQLAMQQCNSLLGVVPNEPLSCPSQKYNDQLRAHESFLPEVASLKLPTEMV